MAMKGPYREFIPVGEQKVRVHLSEGAHLRAAHLLVAENSPHIERNVSELTITVPSILAHEVVAIDI